MTVPAGSDTDVTALTGSGALGVTWSAAARLDVTLGEADDWGSSEVRLVGSAPNAAGPMLIGGGTRPDAFTLQGRPAQVAGVSLRGPVARARARTDHDVRLCAAWPMPLALAPGSLPIEMPIAPRNEAYFGGGWHDMEVQPGVGYFRWMSGPRAQVLIALQRAGPFTFALDAQAPLAPAPGDEVRLSVSGRDLGSRPLFPTRGVYVWDLPADAVREGVTAITIGITRTARPSQGQVGGDARELGLLVRGWTVGPAPSQ